MTRTTAALLVASLLVVLFAWQAQSQPQQGFGPTFDATNQALRVNVVAGGASGGTSSNFGTAFPGPGTAIGGKDPNGAMASFTISNTGRLQVTCDNCSSSAATFGTGYPTSGGAIGYKDALGAFASVTGSNGGFNVNVLSGGGGSSNFGTAFPSAGVAGGYRDSLGALASFTGSNGKQNVIVGNESTVNATVSSANALGTAAPSTAYPLGYRDTLGALASVSGSNGGLNVNILSGAGASANFGTGFPTAGTPGGYKDASGAFASLTGSNGKQNVLVGNESTLIATVTQTTAANLNALVAQGASASTTNLWAVGITSAADALVRPGDSVNNAMRVNIVAGGSTNSSFGTAFPTTGIAGGYKDVSGAFASFTGANGKLNVVVDSASNIGATVSQSAAANLNATVVQGASASVANAWPVIHLDDAGNPVRAGDATNKALRVNMVASSVASGGTSSNFGTVFPTAGTAAGAKDPSGSMASLTVSNTGRLQVTCDNCSSSAATFGTAYPSTGGAIGYQDASGAFASLTGSNGANNVILRDFAGRNLGTSVAGTQSVPLGVQLAPSLPSSQVSLGAKQTTIVNVPQGQAAGTPVRGVTVGGGTGTQGWAQPWIRCDRNASISASNVGFTQVVPAAAGQSIYVCGYTVVAGTTPVGITFGYGTGTNCGSASADITGAMTVAASGGMVNTPTNVGVFDTPPSQALCIKLSNGATVGGHLRYTQF